RVLLDAAESEAHGASAGLETKWPEPGRNVVVSLDMRLQLAAHEALGTARGAAVVIDPSNGDVLALVSTPAFDPNRLAAGLSRSDYAALMADPDKPLFNRALAGRYPPGSTIKPFLGLAALHHETKTAHEHVYCPGFYRLPGNTHRYRDWRPQGHGRIDLHNAIVQSCDVYFYDLAVGLGIDHLAEALYAFGFGPPTGIDINGEIGGVVPSREWKRETFQRPEDKVWFPGETVIAGIGQGYTLATPLQLAHATAVLAARGARYRPRLLIGTEETFNGRIVYRDPEPLPGVDMDDKHWEVVHDALVAVTQAPRGTARTPMLGTEYVVAGKTGTAQVLSIAQDATYDASRIDERHRDHGLFIAYALAEAPRIAVAVVVENGGGGSSAAAPVARKIMDAYFSMQPSTAVGNYVAREHWVGREAAQGARLAAAREAHRRHPVASDPRRGRGDRPRRALQRGRRGHEPCNPAGDARGARLRGILRDGADTAAVSQNMVAVALLWRARVAVRGRGRRRDQPGRAALARSRYRAVPAVGADEARRADDGRLVPARPDAAADVAAAH